MPILEEQPQVKSEVMRSLRMRRHISQQELAQEAGISLGQVSRIESGNIKRPQWRTLRKLARALGVGVNDLLAANDSNDSNGDSS